MGRTSEEILREKCLKTPLGIGVKKLFLEYDIDSDPMFPSYKHKVFHYYKSLLDNTLTESRLFKDTYKAFDIQNGDYSYNFFADVLDSVIMSEYSKFDTNIIKENDQRSYLNSCGNMIGSRIQEFFRVQNDYIEKDDVFCSEELLIGKMKDRYDYNTLDLVCKNKFDEGFNAYLHNINLIKESLGEEKLADDKYLHILSKIVKKPLRRLNYGTYKTEYSLNDDEFKKQLMKQMDLYKISDPKDRPVESYARAVNRFHSQILKIKELYLALLRSYGDEYKVSSSYGEKQLVKVDMNDAESLREVSLVISSEVMVWAIDGEILAEKETRTYRVFDFFYDFEDVYIKPLTKLGATPLECLQAIEKTLVEEIKLLKEVDPDWWGV